MSSTVDPFVVETNGELAWVRAVSLEHPGARHAFSTRLGGVSTGSSATLSFGGARGNTPERARANLERLGSAVGFEPDRLYRVQQVHGAAVVVIESLDEDPRQVATCEADALVTAARGCFVAVQTADCVPVLLLDPHRDVVAAVHAGWRGVVGGVLQRTLAVMKKRFGCRAAELSAAVGPSIGPCCFEVGLEVAAAFDCFDGSVVWQRRDPSARPHVDLRRAVQQILLDGGLEQASVAVTELCTGCRPDLFYSYRCQGADTGRHVNLIGLT